MGGSVDLLVTMAPMMPEEVGEELQGMLSLLLDVRLGAIDRHDTWGV